MAPGQLPDPPAQLLLLDVCQRHRAPLGIAMLTCQPACTPLKNPESILAEPLRPCDDAPGLEVSLGKLLERGFIKLSICKKALKARVLQFKLLEAFGLCGFHPAV